MNTKTADGTKAGMSRIVFAFRRRVGIALGLTGLVLSILACSVGNVPTVTMEPTEPVETPSASASISGIVWHDLCVIDNRAAEPPPGCVKDANENIYVGNGILESNEAGISGAAVGLGSGSCPSPASTSVITDANGRYQIGDLQPGVYCASAAIGESHLPSASEPGIWTFPVGGDGSTRGMQTVVLLAGEQRGNVSFGWSYLNQPAVPEPAPTSEPTATPRCVDAAAFVKDVTVPDGTQMEPGKAFTKTWRMRNTGTCTWTDAYDLVFLSGFSLDGSSLVPLKSNVAPGQTVDLSVAMKAPKDSGTYWGYWGLRNDQGAIFGVGEKATGPVWVKIQVEPDITDWRGEYYNNRKLDGDPVLVRNDQKIDFNWKDKAPSSSLPSDDFSVRWSRELKFEDGVYRFSFSVDDGVRLWVDDRLVLDEWETGSVREVAVTLQMKKGKHGLKVEYFERGGQARISMNIANTTVPTGQFWNGTYWFNRTLDSEWALIKSVDTLDFDWGAGSPARGLPENNFSIRWKRTVAFEPGVYRFNARADDGLRVYVDGERIIDEWHASSAAETYKVEVPLSGLHEIQVEYFEQSGNAKIAFWWEYLGPQNRPPVANSDQYETVADKVFKVPAPGVLGNDQDPDGDGLTAKLVASPVNGIIVLYGDGSFEYQPAPGFSGKDMFSYRASDGKLDSSDALVTLTVLPSNTPPKASDDAFEGPAGQPMDIPVPGVLENDIDAEAQVLKAYLEAGPGHGSLVLRQDGSFLYTPDPEYTGKDEFTYRVSDGLALSNIATVTVNLIPQNTAPVAADDIFEAEEGRILTIAAPGILVNDFDPEGQTLQIIIESGPEFGDLTLGEDGAFSYLPDVNFKGDDVFLYRVSDGEKLSEIARVVIRVSPASGLR